MPGAKAPGIFFGPISGFVQVCGRKVIRASVRRSVVPAARTARGLGAIGLAAMLRRFSTVAVGWAPEQMWTTAFLPNGISQLHCFAQKSTSISGCRYRGFPQPLCMGRRRSMWITAVSRAATATCIVSTKKSPPCAMCRRHAPADAPENTDASYELLPQKVIILPAAAVYHGLALSCGPPHLG